MRIAYQLFTLALVAAPVTSAQPVLRTPRVQTWTLTASDDKDRAMLGVSTTTGGRRDTLGLLVSSVVAGGPAEKAGIEEGNRLLAINGVNLKLSRDDADDEDMQGINQNRLTREMRKMKPGEEVTLDVWGGGRSRTVKVKAVSAAELNPARKLTAPVRDEDRAAIGLFLTTTGNKRDTVGVFVQRVVDGGPADKAGIVEGDRIASINGVDVRVPREDAGEWSVGSSRIDRLEREVHKLRPGQSTDVVVVSGGRSHTVRLTAVKAADLPGGGMIPMPNSNFHVMPRIRINRGSGVISEEFGDEFRYQLEEGLKGLRDIGPQIRKELERTRPARVTVRAVNRVMR